MEVHNFPEFSEDDLKLDVPCGIMVSGTTKSGKTTYILTMLKFARELFKRFPASRLYCYGTENDTLRSFINAGCVLHKGLPSEEVIDKLPKPAIIILDDLMIDAKSKYLEDLYTRQVHHKDLILFFVTQYLFVPHARIARANTQYFVFMKAPMDQLSIRNIGYQWYPLDKNFLKSAYKQATDRKYGYLFSDMSPGANDQLRHRTNIFPGEQMEIFLPSR
jgi:hypothetical protein